MGRQIIIQPNGRYALWSSVVDDFVLFDASEKQMIESLIEEQAAVVREQVKRKIEELKADLKEGTKKAYYQFTMTWDEACERAKRLHGEKWQLPKLAGKRK
jgi:hypothetical protein